MSVVNLIFVCCFIACAQASGNHSLPEQYCVYAQKPLPNYYWRKYEGIIPHDAVPGGHTSSGSITYIAQVLLTNYNTIALLPGTIKIGQTEVEIPINGVEKRDKYVAILCSNTPSALKWRLVNEHELNTVNEPMVVGGYEAVRTAYVGRASYENHLIVGKVFTEEYKGLRIVTPDHKEKLITTFEVLVYNPLD